MSTVPLGRLLVINDAPSVCERLARWLKQKGYQFIFVGSPQEADNLMKHDCFDAIIYGHEFRFPRRFLPRRSAVKGN